MSALYQVQYQGIAGVGHGAIYIGKGKVLGIDITGARYDGSYTTGTLINGGNLTGIVTLTAAGGTLVTGQPVPPGTKVPVSFHLPPNLGDGQFQSVTVGGKPAQVAFVKIGDIP